jgi:hypothetical protein
MSINMFELEGWRLKAKVKKTFLLKPQAIQPTKPWRSGQRTSNLQQFLYLPLATYD